VDDDDLFVFVNDVERNVFGNRVDDGGGRNFAGYLFAGLEAVTGFDRFAVDRDVAAADRALNRRPARLAEARGEGEGEAVILGLGGNREGERRRRGGRGKEGRRDSERVGDEVAARNFIVLPLNGNWSRAASRPSISPSLRLSVSPSLRLSFFPVSQRR